jgi:hypothetical protein
LSFYDTCRSRARVSLLAFYQTTLRCVGHRREERRVVDFGEKTGLLSKDAPV